MGAMTVPWTLIRIALQAQIVAEAVLVVVELGAGSLARYSAVPRNNLTIL
jgi:hypothetical protein